MWQVLRWLWALPVSVAGLLLGAMLVLRGGHMRCRDHTIEFHGAPASPCLAATGQRWSIVAMTLGHVILAQDAAAADSWRTHEHVHVRQYERWGALFPVAYLVASGLAWLRGGDAYLDNAFEVEARVLSCDRSAFPGLGY